MAKLIKGILSGPRGRIYNVIGRKGVSGDIIQIKREEKYDKVNPRMRQNSIKMAFLMNFWANEYGRYQRDWARINFNYSLLDAVRFSNGEVFDSKTGWSNVGLKYVFCCGNRVDFVSNIAVQSKTQVRFTGATLPLPVANQLGIIGRYVLMFNSFNTQSIFAWSTGRFQSGTLTRTAGWPTGTEFIGVCIYTTNNPSIFYVCKSSYVEMNL